MSLPHSEDFDIYIYIYIYIYILATVWARTSMFRQRIVQVNLHEVHENLPFAVKNA